MTRADELAMALEDGAFTVGEVMDVLEGEWLRRFREVREEWAEGEAEGERSTVEERKEGLTVRKWFTYHTSDDAPHSASILRISEQEKRKDVIRERCYGMALDLLELVPSSRERSTALSRLREVEMWASAGIDCNPREERDG